MAWSLGRSVAGAAVDAKTDKKVVLEERSKRESGQTIAMASLILDNLEWCREREREVAANKGLKATLVSRAGTIQRTEEVIKRPQKHPESKLQKPPK